MVNLLSMITMLLELFVQLKRRDDVQNKQARLQLAKSDPAAYLAQFGRVQHVSATDEPKSE